MLFYLKEQNIELKQIKGIADKRENALKDMGIFSLYNLLMYIPKSYEDRTQLADIADIEKSCYAGVIIKVTSNAKISYLKNRKSVVKINAVSSGIKGSIVIYNASYSASRFAMDKEYYVYGWIEAIRQGFVITNPKSVFEYNDLSSALKIFAEYRIPQNINISQNTFRLIINNALSLCKNNICDLLTNEIKNELDIMDIRQAILCLHLPENKSDIIPARDRLAFDEVFSAILYLKQRKKEITGRKNNFIINDLIREKFTANLNYVLTEAQINAVNDIIFDMGKDAQVMNRLVQGDVGCGKTIVAFYALINASKNGYQSAFIAPTEMLAKQHFENIKKLTDIFNVKAVLLTSSSKDREEAKKALRQEEGIIAIGTHALFSGDIEYNNLALVITDEQHKFGVAQRARIANKGKNPHILMMSATPIPRTLSMALYANLDVSIIDQMPPERRPVLTYSTDYSNKKRLYKYIENKVKSAQQCYIVCAGIEPDEDENIFSLEQQYKELSKDLSGINIGYIHGKMSAQDKDNITNKFINNEISVLVATTVIEVGVDVANANLIVINNAERFGLSQLHQLRGRDGRGSAQGQCILLTDSKSEMAAKRIEILKNSSDGFEIAQQDLYLRGPGEMFGYRQHGMFNFKYADIYKNPELIYKANKAADMMCSDEKYSDTINKILNLFYLNQSDVIDN
ncbi:MAG: ATP-dependent DNA helicase RecG [Eubacteriaceae bacterium]|nr:ATP-dependent DNA helicase RecG [Eubacteriaceae bacterium]